MTTKTANEETETVQNEIGTCKSKINAVNPHKLKNLVLKNKIKNAKSAGNQDIFERKLFLLSELVEEQVKGQTFIDIEAENKFTFIADSHYVRSLNLSQNSLTCMPDLKLQAWSVQLLILNLQKNQLSQLAFLSCCINLQLCNLSCNRIQQSQELFYLAKLHHLQELYLNQNLINLANIQKTLTADIWPDLKSLDISNNQITDPHELSCFFTLITSQSLKCINLHNNPCTFTSKSLHNKIVSLSFNEVISKYSEFNKYQKLGKVCFIQEPVQSIQNRLIYLLNPNKKQPQTVMPVVSSFTDWQHLSVQESAPTTIIQEESPPFKAMQSPKIEKNQHSIAKVSHHLIADNLNANSTMKAWLNSMVPHKISRPLAGGEQPRKIDNQTNIEDLDKTFFTPQDKPKRQIEAHSRQNQLYNHPMTPEQIQSISKNKTSIQKERSGKIGPFKGKNLQFRMVQLAPSAYASRRSSSIPSGATSSRKSLNSKGHSNSSDKLKTGVMQAYGSSCGKTSIDSNYGPHFTNKPPENYVADEKEPYQTFRNRSVSVHSQSQKGKNAFATIGKNNDDHNIYHQKSITRKQQSSLSRRKFSRQQSSEQLRNQIKSSASFRSNSKTKEQTLYYLQQKSPSKEKKQFVFSPKQFKVAQASNLNLQNVISAGINYGLVNSSHLKLLHNSYSGVKIAQQNNPTSSRSYQQAATSLQRKSTTPIVKSNFFQTVHGQAVVNQIADSGQMGMKVIVDSNYPISENDSSLNNFQHSKIRKDSVHNGYMQMTKNPRNSYHSQRKFESHNSSRKSKISHEEISAGSSQKMEERSRSETPNAIKSKIKRIMGAQVDEDLLGQRNRSLSSEESIEIPSLPTEPNLTKDTPLKFPKGPQSTKNFSQPKITEVPSPSESHPSIGIQFANKKVQNGIQSPLAKRSFARGTSNESKKNVSKSSVNSNTIFNQTNSNKKFKKVPIGKSMDISSNPLLQKQSQGKVQMKRNNQSSSLNNPVSPVSTSQTNIKDQRLKSSSIKVPKLGIPLSNVQTPTQKVGLQMSAREVKKFTSPPQITGLVTSVTSHVLTKMQLKTKQKVKPTQQTKKLRIQSRKDLTSQPEVIRDSLQSLVFRSDFNQHVATASVLTLNSNDDQVVFSLSNRSKQMVCKCKLDQCPLCQIQEHERESLNFVDANSAENQELMIQMNEDYIPNSHKSSTSSFLKISSKTQHKSTVNSFLQNLKLQNEPSAPCHSHTASLTGQNLQMLSKFNNLSFRKPPSGIFSSKMNTYELNKIKSSKHLALPKSPPVSEIVEAKQQTYQSTSIRLVAKFQSFATQPNSQHVSQQTSQQNSLRSSKE